MNRADALVVVLVLCVALVGVGIALVAGLGWALINVGMLGGVVAAVFVDVDRGGRR